MALGIDLGSFDSKMVELVESNDAIEVKVLGTRPLFSDISIYNTEKLNKAVWSNNIQQLCEEKNLSIRKQKQVAFSIPSSKSIFKFHKTLDMPNDELISTLELEAKKLLPGSSNVEPIIDYHILGQDSIEIDKINLILMGANREIVSEYNDIGKKTGFKNIILDTEASAILNCYLVN